MTKQSKGLAFVEFAQGEDAARALAELDMQFFQARRVGGRKRGRYLGSDPDMPDFRLMFPYSSSLPLCLSMFSQGHVSLTLYPPHPASLPPQGRLLHLLPAHAPPQVATVEEVAGSEGFKAQKEAKLKAGAGDRKIWSSLFVRADTVADAIAARFGARFGRAPCVR